MNEKQKKVVAIAATLAAAIAGSLLTALPDNATVHTVCEWTLKLLAIAGFTAPVSILGPTAQAQAASTPPEQK